MGNGADGEDIKIVDNCGFGKFEGGGGLMFNAKSVYKFIIVLLV